MRKIAKALFTCIDSLAAGGGGGGAAGGGAVATGHTGAVALQQAASSEPTPMDVQPSIIDEMELMQREREEFDRDCRELQRMLDDLEAAVRKPKKRAQLLEEARTVGKRVAAKGQVAFKKGRLYAQKYCDTGAYY